MTWKEKLHPTQYIGITEAGEVAFDLSVFDRLYIGNIIITKRLTTKLIEKLVEQKDRIILHLTCTGMGGSRVEPLVPTVTQTIQKYTQLIASGFPFKQVVLRIDPIIPTEKGILSAIEVIKQFKQNELLKEEERLPERIRYSVLDMYPHVIKRFNEAGFPIPYNTFHAPDQARQNVRQKLLEISKEMGFDLEACAEPGLIPTPCISQKDIDILGLTNTIILTGRAGQRKTCGCPANKHELLNGTPHKCSNGCVYCFWKD